jgi:hypothetical protein
MYFMVEYNNQEYTTEMREVETFMFGLLDEVFLIRGKTSKATVQR